MPEGEVCMNALSGLKTASEDVWCDLSWWYANRCCWLDSIHLARREERGEERRGEIYSSYLHYVKLAWTVILAELYLQSITSTEKMSGFLSKIWFFFPNLCLDFECLPLDLMITSQDDLNTSRVPSCFYSGFNAQFTNPNNICHFDWQNRLWRSIAKWMIQPTILHFYPHAHE